MILVTGATGNVGREVVNLLLARGAKVLGVTRHPETAGLPGGVVAVGGDPSHPQTLTKALLGVEAVFISPRALGDATAGTATAELLKLAADQGVQRVVALSAVTVEYGGGEGRFADAFRAVEDAVRASGLAWAILRCSEFNSNAMVWAPQIRAEGKVRGAYGEATTSPVHERDVASVSALALLDATHAGRTHVLTGPQPLTQRERVHLIGQAIGREVSWEEIPPQVVRAAMLAQGVPPDVPDRLLGYLSSLDRLPGPSSQDVSEVLGRPALTFAEWAVEHAAAFRS